MRISKTITQRRASISLHPVIHVLLPLAGFYVVFTVIALATHNWNPLWFTWMGERYANLDPGGRTGYDGQFIYYLARDGWAAVAHLDVAPYRMQRIMLPAIVRIVSLGHPSIIPWLLPVVNLAAITVTVSTLAQWLRSQDLPGWYAIGYGLYIGTFLAYSRDLTEPLAYCLASLGFIWWLEKRHASASVCLAAAALAKETTLLFMLSLIAAELVSRRLKPSLILGAAMLPLVVWEAILWLHFGRPPFIAGPSLQLIPLSGILPYLTLEPGRVSAFLFVALPASALLSLSIWRLVKNVQDPAGWALLLNCLFIILMPVDVYDHIMHAGRNAAGMVVAGLLCFPQLDTIKRRLIVVWWVLPTLVWFIPVLRWAPWLSKI
jgi:hypothetical protein